MADYKKTAASILEQIGGENNVRSITHCQTRLRIALVDNSSVDDENVKAIPGVMGVVRRGEQYQVIIGNEVQECYKEICKLGSFGDKTEERNKEKFTLKAWGNSVLDMITGSMSPVIPVILGCGMVKLLLIMMDLVGVSSELPTYQILTIIGDVGFYFLPLLLAYSAAKKMECSPMLAVTIVAVLIHPNLIALLSESGTSFLRIPVTVASYSSTVIPPLLSVWFLSKVEPLVDKICKGWTKTVFKPTLLLLICVPVSLILLAPLGAVIGDGMAYVLNFMQTKAGWLTLGVYSALLPFVVLAGMHVALFPYIFGNLGTLGYDVLQLPAMLAYNLSQGAACAAVAIRTKNKDLKAVATTSAVSAMVAGISEPGLYGVTMRLRKPLYASMIGSGLAGVVIGLFKVKAFTFSNPSLMAIFMYASPEYERNIVYALVAAGVSVVVTFVATLILGWDDPEEAEAALAGKDKADDAGSKEYAVTSPIIGEMIPLSEVKDETFASGMLGQGIAVNPSEGKVIAPFDGTVEALFPTNHAVGLRSADGMVELLIHVGIDTVELNGEGFKGYVKQGDIVKQGDLLVEFDIEAIRKKRYDTVVPVIVSNTAEFAEIRPSDKRHVDARTVVMNLMRP